ncbi:22650_t:CDS:2, partial [Gigaspora margarita]
LSPQQQNPELLPKQNFKILPKNLSQVAKNANDRLPARTLRACQVLYNDLLQIDEEVYDNIEPIDSLKAGPGPKTERSSCQDTEKDQTNKEFKRLSIIIGDNEKSIIFKEQNMGPALKRRAVAVHNAKVSKYHPDNGSDIRKMLESQRKPFRKLLEKEFDKRGQFKFSLCSLTKFLIDNKPGNKEKDKKKNLRTDWLRNKQIIVYNRAEIDDYLSDAFEQILYQVEEKG